jgi:hypothetical protein
MTGHRSGSNPHRGRPCQCPLWVKSGHHGVNLRCPLYPQKRTLTEPDLETVICPGAKDDSVQDEEWRQQLLREQERDRRQAILDWHVEQIRAAEAAERAYWREMREALDPFNYGHWR